MAKKLEYNNRIIITDSVRVVYPNLQKPKAFEPGKPEYYSIKFLWPKGPLKCRVKKDGEYKDSDLSTVLKELRQEAWKGKDAGYEAPVVDGDTQDHDFVQGHFSANAKNFPDKKPLVIDGAKNELEAHKIYSGCYCRIQLSPQPWENMGKKGIRFNLLAVQFVKDGEIISGGATGKIDDFEVVEGFTKDSSKDDF